MRATTFALLLAFAILGAGCASDDDVQDADGVRRVVSDVRGITCAGCAATIEVALRRRLDGVRSVSISESQQRSDVAFRGTHEFSSEIFRQAHKTAGVEVIAMDIEACGSIESEQDRKWLVAGPNRFMLEGQTSAPGARICVSGRLQESGTGGILVTSIRTAAANR